ncbi:hypothetical protein ACJJTC_013400 [Scirpophaga incertulas]
MSGGLVQYVCCLIILTIFVKRGDGRWKRKDRENLQTDIESFNDMADKVVYEIESLYDEYPDANKTGNVNKMKYRYDENVLKNLKTNTLHHSKGHFLNKNEFPIFQNETMELSHVGKVNKINSISVINVGRPNSDVNKKLNWPTFEDILLEMGKRYDWKNDRWLKVKRKLKNIRNGKIKNNNIGFHEKHKFYYRIVKLNRSKDRRNVVVAVSAVR